MKKLIIIILILTLILSCVTIKPNNDPVIIREIPTVDVTDDMTLEAYLYNTTKFQIDIVAYVKELIAQIKLKCQNIDIR